MATLESILTAVNRVLDDDVFTSDTLTVLVNQGIDYCATRILLPRLEASGTVSTLVGVSRVEIPTAWLFMRNLYACFGEDNDTSIKVLNSITNLLDFYPDYKTDLDEGDIEYVTVTNNHLIYYPIPATSIELISNFYTEPTHLVNDADIPTCLPYGTHEELLENYVLWKAWSELEDGIEGPKTNTKYYQELFLQAFNELDAMIDHGQSRARPVIENGWI